MYGKTLGGGLQTAKAAGEGASVLILLATNQSDFCHNNRTLSIDIGNKF
jgi:hypothetical protein